jgi:hypothetical protein
VPDFLKSLPFTQNLFAGLEYCTYEVIGRQTFAIVFFGGKQSETCGFKIKSDLNPKGG